MITLQRVARKHGLVCLLHEKPFSGVNGSGKHNNWAMATDTGANLLEPGDNPHDNMQFLFFCVAVIKAVHKHQDLLRISVSSAGNDHRLGANEAPPAIMSVFLGEQLEDVLMQLIKGGAKSSKQGGFLGLGVSSLPTLPRHAGDRNRTSPFAFTGNKFEFRAVGSQQTVSVPIAFLNVMVADALDEMATDLESKLAGKKKSGKDFENAVAAVLRTTMKAAKAVIFGGDNYAESWHVEAEKRGLLNLRTSVEALQKLISHKNISLFERFNVLSRTELVSRHEIWMEQYVLTVNIEAATTEHMAATMILPAAAKYLAELTDTLIGCDAVGFKQVGLGVHAKKLNTLVDKLQKVIAVLHDANGAPWGEHAFERSVYMQSKVIPAMAAVRGIVDELETVVSREHWPMPAYTEILFVK
jgi:glutamine synthetase